MSLDLAFAKNKLAQVLLKAGFNPAQPRDADGKWSESGGARITVTQTGFAAGKGALKISEARKVTNAIARKFKVAPSKIWLRTDLDIKNPKLMGRFSPKSGMVEVFLRNISSEGVLKGIVAHELAHNQFRTWVSKAAEVDPTTFGIDATLKKLGYDLDKLRQTGGITQYAKRFWIGTEKQPGLYRLAVEETIAEIARMKHGTTSQEHYLNHLDTESFKNIAPEWTKLYNTITKYRAPKPKKTGRILRVQKNQEAIENLQAIIAKAGFNPDQQRDERGMWSKYKGPIIAGALATGLIVGAAALGVKGYRHQVFTTAGKYGIAPHQIEFAFKPASSMSGIPGRVQGRADFGTEKLTLWPAFIPPTQLKGIVAHESTHLATKRMLDIPGVREWIGKNMEALSKEGTGISAYADQYWHRADSFKVNPDLRSKVKAILSSALSESNNAESVMKDAYNHLATTAFFESLGEMALRREQGLGDFFNKGRPLTAGFLDTIMKTGGRRLGPSFTFGVS